MRCLHVMLGLSVLFGAAGTAGSADTPQEFSIKVLNAGAEPRQRLRYTFTAGATETMVMDMKMRMKTEGAGGDAPQIEIPTMRMTMRISVDEVLPGGDARMSFDMTRAEVLDEPGALPAVVEAMQAELDKVVGMKGTGIITPRGETKEARFELPEGASPQMKQQMQSMEQSLGQMSAPLPEEPVGKGAKWTVTMPLSVNQIEATQVATYTLKELDGDSLTADVTIVQSAPEQKVKLPEAGGVEVTFKSLKTTGGGSSKFDLSAIVPEAQMKLSVRMVMAAQGQEMTMSMGMEMVIRKE